MSSLRSAFIAGYECLSAWADLLDRINVFPVADGDTGANLRISLAPLRDGETGKGEIGELLVRCAIGNSGNIAAVFFREFLQAEHCGELAATAARGKEKAWQAIARPQAGTMLTVFDALAATLDGQTEQPALYPMLCKELQGAVLATAETLADLRQAGVVDAGALGMYVFFEGFFRQLTGQAAMAPPPLPAVFSDKLTVRPDFQAPPAACFCVNAFLHHTEGGSQASVAEVLTALGESIVTLPAQSGLRVHIHTADRQRLRTRLSSLGEIVEWQEEAVHGEGGDFFASGPRPAVHIMTDAAGSLTRDLARRHGITLLDSYVVTQGVSRPETLSSPPEIYSLMRQGVRVSTAQASIFERHCHYQSVCQQFDHTVYLCVGSAFTGNYEVARRWQEKEDANQSLALVDTGAASGRLGLIALLAARHAAQAASVAELLSFVEKTRRSCEEYLFVDALRYLVAGGRVSRVAGGMADLVGMQPVIAPVENGLRKAGVVRGRKGQLTFALARLPQAAASTIMLQYSDNEEWVRETVEPRVREVVPSAEILLVPLSLTSGVHLGPGAWSIAWSDGQTR